MVAGLPVSAWILLLVSAGLGLAIEIRFFLRARRWYDSAQETAPDRD